MSDSSATAALPGDTGMVYDFIGIGLGPFNLGLAALSAPISELNGLFLECSARFDWHPGMMLETSTLQVPFLADLVTLADPTSSYSFLNYLKEAGRIYPFYIRENFNPLRAEYNQYCQWVAEQLPNVRFDSFVDKVILDDSTGHYQVRLAGGALVRARRLVVGTGTTPSVPASCAGLPGPVFHNAQYVSHKADLQRMRNITIVGGGQSAAEIYYELLQEADAHDYHLTWVTRSGRFFPLEYAKLTLEMTSPEYTGYFQALPAATRDDLIADQKNLYKGINEDLINDIYDLLYLKSLGGPVNTTLLTNSALTGAEWDGLHYSLRFTQQEQEQDFTLLTEGLVLATGYSAVEPAFLDDLQISRDDRGRLQADADYRIDARTTTGTLPAASALPGAIYVQNAELHTHGLVAPDLGMGAYRNSCIIRDMLGWEYYPVESRIAFQHFGAPAPEHSGAIR
ncbi:SidA/IucD/PvdA family monooxygenase [Cryobacterium sp. PH31-O1]|uniref:lysine N(6)-hydroxylase/L-ornithine N(5)-oxygenase family protein n=1 Tax=Cryobacterium sp. PH31-O1 TaxID=3046306 RepID=UPI0024B9222F|nr:SidA/IucD/PvdA family monooxygenase [Cryobacterium sp. PH31-O1]MDJ0336847.1 SidA/IucD/PvdA family monooxygenase [Cryobacterium sp. PH31-O1]